jgi:hypothetical protein
MRLLVYKNPGTGPIVTPVIMVAESELTSFDEHMSGIDSALEPTIIEDTNLPDRKYTMAWELINGAVTINFDKAKEIKKGILRMLRTPLLTELDIAFQRALETNADTTAIVAEKQRLRDITNLVDQVTTLEELDAITLAQG